ncbi:hypothetical protein VOLCADRAFT_104496 [Volvox carteri f. nagariensis]|uniref:Pherophorin domain-containing protein n=1 Tax=Volvox carteri f. nagariensis TaxID=3068 RepID=D8TU01_VOLCA|nr:uncharacterized protein VOLCADRAFT_104496 [Volvox carteri f. nagariensis]EFJ49056.1 hypothetical protein VOLCADRAFT_104496 [Volvox carteri f. nagariensis]|eukprot:XP_002949953.1 hypothetical protein VOLCADRAFT_104496 [Volvox carteri f. nagariensis]
MIMGTPRSALQARRFPSASRALLLAALLACAGLLVHGHVISNPPPPRKSPPSPPKTKPPPPPNNKSPPPFPRAKPPPPSPLAKKSPPPLKRQPPRFPPKSPPLTPGFPFFCNFRVRADRKVNDQSIEFPANVGVCQAANERIVADLTSIFTAVGAFSVQINPDPCTVDEDPAFSVTGTYAHRNATAVAAVDGYDLANEWLLRLWSSLRSCTGGGNLFVTISTESPSSTQCIVGSAALALVC